MIDQADLRLGDKVHYIPFEGCHSSLIENGMVKEIPDHTFKEVRVVYNCGGEWERFEEYTSALTPLKNLKKGWFFNDKHRMVKE